MQHFVEANQKTNQTAKRNTAWYQVYENRFFFKSMWWVFNTNMVEVQFMVEVYHINRWRLGQELYIMVSQVFFR